MLIDRLPPDPEHAGGRPEGVVAQARRGDGLNGVVVCIGVLEAAQEVLHDIGSLADIAADLDGDHVVVRQVLAVGNVRAQDVRDRRAIAVDARPFGADFLPVLRHLAKDPSDGGRIERHICGSLRSEGAGGLALVCR
jgi:hypothetical protein